MRLVTFSTDDGAKRVGAWIEGEICDLRRTLRAATGLTPGIAAWARDPSGDMIGFIASGAHRDPRVAELVAGSDPGARVSAGAARLHAPVPRPGKIVCIGRNYRDHIAEGKLEVETRPRIFFKSPGAVVGPRDPLVRPGDVRTMDWEAELAVVVAATVRGVPAERALRHVAGYLALNDVSAREFQFASPAQTSFAKSMDSFCPIGPALVTPDEVPDPGDLDIRCWVNDTLVQNGNTGEMVMSPAGIIAYVSRYITLECGDVVATGTPAGVGHFRRPPRYLVPGDVVTTEISVLGRLENPVVDAAAGAGFAGDAAE